jgi:integrase
VLSLVAVFVPR